MKFIRTSEVLQSHFNDCDSSWRMTMADRVIMLDVCDCDDSVGDRLLGIDHGMGLYELMLAVREIAGNENAGIYKLTFNDYADDDGIALFVGTEEGLAKLFLLNQAK